VLVISASTNEKQSKMNTVVKLHRQLNETNCTLALLYLPNFICIAFWIADQSDRIDSTVAVGVVLLRERPLSYFCSIPLFHRFIHF